MFVEASACIGWKSKFVIDNCCAVISIVNLLTPVLDYFVAFISYLNFWQ